MDNLSNVQALQQKTGLVLALKTDGGKALADDLARRLADWLHKLVVTAKEGDDLIQLLYEVRGAAKLLGDLGYDVRSVIDLAAKNAVKQQMQLTKPPTVRRDHAHSTEGETEDGE